MPYDNADRGHCLVIVTCTTSRCKNSADWRIFFLSGVTLNSAISGVTLSASHQSETWDPEAKAEYPRSNKLLIRQALLGPDAKPDELNVVQVNMIFHSVTFTWYFSLKKRVSCHLFFPLSFLTSHNSYK